MKQLKKYSILFVLLFISLSVLARLGGAGGDDGGGGGDFGGGSDWDSSSDSSGDGEVFAILMYLLASLPFPFNLLAFALLAFLVWRSYRGYNRKSSLNTFKKIETGFISDNHLHGQIAQLKNFNEKEFIEKMKKAFYEMQMAWSEKKLGKVRKYISDGMYQRFAAQVLMMNELKQTNKIAKLAVSEFKIVAVESEGDNDILHVQVKAYIQDQFVSERFSKLNQKFDETFVEFWTFIRKKNASGNDIYTDDNCPNCKAVLPEDIGEVSVCQSCGTFTNLGDHDWVLCEITQPAHFIRLWKNNGYRKKMMNEIAAKAQFNLPVQWLEDKAANAFLQLKISHALKDKNRIRRFSTKQFADEFEVTKRESLLYNRLFLEHVTMINLFEKEENYIAAFHMNFTVQQVSVSNDKLEMIDTLPYSDETYLLLTRKKAEKASKFSAYSHKCSSCGASSNDSLNVECEFCGNVLNDDSKDWIVMGMMNAADYKKFRETQEPAVGARTESHLEKIDMDIRDYVLNNMIAVMAADGTLSPMEKDYSYAMARKMGYNPKNIAALWASSASGHLAIKMPGDKSKCEKVVKQMEKAAMADGNLGEDEKLLIEEIRKKYLN